MDQPIVPRKSYKKVMPNRTVPIVLKMIEPVAGFDERWTMSTDCIGKADAIGCAAVTNILPFIRRRQSIALDGKDFDWLGYILEILWTESAIAECELFLLLIVSLARTANAAVLRDAFETGGNIDAVAVQIVVFNDDVAKMHADTKRHLAVAR